MPGVCQPARHSGPALLDHQAATVLVEEKAVVQRQAISFYSLLQLAQPSRAAALSSGPPSGAVTAKNEAPSQFTRAPSEQRQDLEPADLRPMTIDRLTQSGVTSVSPIPTSDHQAR